MSTLRRYEIQVPLMLDSTQPASRTLLTTTLSELRDRFGAVSWETQVVQGAWEYGGATFRDKLTRFFVDVPDSPDNAEFFKKYKQKLKERFDQVDVWITSHLIEVI